MGVSVITCTHLNDYRDNIFRNYARQDFQDKELILILNDSGLDIEEWRFKAGQYPNVRVFMVPENVSVGSCMNFAIEQAKHEYLANFDHDDFYGRRYLNDFMDVAPMTDAGLFGKKSHFVYFEGNGLLTVMHPGYEGTYVDYVDGPTMFIKKNTTREVKFIDNDISDCRFSWDCRDKGIKIYSVNKLHFAYIRRPDANTHTWKISNEDLVRTYCQVIGNVDDFKPYIGCEGEA